MAGSWDRTLTALQRSARVSPEMEPDEGLRRTLLLAASLIYTVVGLLWGGMYAILGEPWAGLIPLGYGVLTGLNVWLFVTTGRERWFRESQLALTLLLPFLLQLALGGIGPSGWDLLDRGALTDMPVLMGATGGTPRHSLVLEPAFPAAVSPPACRRRAHRGVRGIPGLAGRRGSAPRTRDCGSSVPSGNLPG